MNFDHEVLEKSQDKPIVVDFWAPWCGPCQYLGPNLDKLAKEQSEEWELVKINVDDHEEISSQYAVRSIPAVKMFHKGEVIAEFTGALPLSQIEGWLAEHLPREAKKEYDQILESEDNIPDQNFIDAMKSLVTENPGFKDARLAIARHLVFTSPVEAIEAIENIKLGEQGYDTAERVRQLADFMGYQTTDTSSVANAIANAQQAIKEVNIEKAIQQIIEANRLDKNFENDLPRLTAIAIFVILGPKHDLTRRYRPEFDMVLY